MKQRIIIIQSSVILILLIILILMLVNFEAVYNVLVKDTPAKQIYLEFEDSFSDIELVDYLGNVVAGLPKGDGFTVVTYLSDSCSTCIDVLSDFKRFSQVFGEELNYTILWVDDVPQSYLTKYSIDESINFSLNNTKISTSTPTFYIVDKSSNIIFRDIRRDNLIKKLIEMEVVSPETLIENSNQFILKNYFALDNNNPKLVYFYMPGCPDCKVADAFLKDSELAKEVDVAYIYKYNSTDYTKDIDKDQLFTSVYGITWYPSFLVFEGDNYRLIGETPIDNLLNELFPEIER